MARRPGISEEDVVRCSGTAYVTCLVALLKKGLRPAVRPTKTVWRYLPCVESVPDGIRRGEPKYPIADCLVRADALKPTTR